MAERDATDIVQLKLRFRETTRAALADAADRNGNSLNSEIVARLEASLRSDAVYGGQATAQALQIIAAEIERVERRTGESWLTDHVTHWAVRERLNAIIPNFVPEMINSDRINAALDEFDALERQMEGLIGILESVGAVGARVENALARYATNPFPRGLFGSSAPRSLVQQPPEPDPMPLPNEEYLNLVMELTRRQKMLKVNPLMEVGAWSLEENGAPMPEGEKIGIKAVIQRARDCANQIDAKRTEIVDLNEPNRLAQMEGKALAAKLAGGRSLPGEEQEE